MMQGVIPNAERNLKLPGFMRFLPMVDVSEPPKGHKLRGTPNDRSGHLLIVQETPKNQFFGVVSFFNFRKDRIPPDRAHELLLQATRFLAAIRMLIAANT